MIFKTTEVEGLTSLASVWASESIRWSFLDSKALEKLKELSPVGEDFMQHTFSNLSQKDSTLTLAQITEKPNLKKKKVWNCFWIVHQQNISKKC